MDDLFSQISELIQSARTVAVRNVNTLQVLTNFEIGQRIVRHEQKGAERAEYGTSLLDELSDRLSSRFGKGFSVTNLRLMRQFFQMYKEVSIHQTVSDELDQSEKRRTLSGEFKSLSSNHMADLERIRLFTDTFSLSWSHYIFLL